MGKTNRKIPEINAGSMADIAFLLLIFFLVTTTIDTDSGIARKLPPLPEDELEEPPKIKPQNLLIIIANKNEEITYKKRYLRNDGTCCDEDLDSRPPENIKVNPKELKEISKKFITNNGKDPTMSVSPIKAIISLEAEYCSYETYISAQNSLAAAYKEIRNEESIKLYSKKYERLDKEKQVVIKKSYPQKISEADIN
tara:strand:- start:3144 stop:3734 length:591 start_codon:yes stop_codon:yes gene_type:complete